MSRYRLSCNGRFLAQEHSADLIQYIARVHANTFDHLPWEFDPDSPTVTTAVCEGRIYVIEIVPWEQRRRRPA